jgi:hypothetical protein
MQLNNTLNPALMRQLVWNGTEFPRVSAVPITSVNDQPLYGLGTNSLKPLYQRTEKDRGN